MGLDRLLIPEVGLGDEGRGVGGASAGVGRSPDSTPLDGFPLRGGSALGSARSTMIESSPVPNRSSGGWAVAGSFSPAAPEPEGVGTDPIDSIQENDVDSAGGIGSGGGSFRRRHSYSWFLHSCLLVLFWSRARTRHHQERKTPYDLRVDGLGGCRTIHRSRIHDSRRALPDGLVPKTRVTGEEAKSAAAVHEPTAYPSRRTLQRPPRGAGTDKTSWKATDQSLPRAFSGGRPVLPGKSRPPVSAKLAERFREARPPVAVRRTAPPGPESPVRSGPQGRVLLPRTAAPMSPLRRWRQSFSPERLLPLLNPRRSR